MRKAERGARPVLTTPWTPPNLTPLGTLPPHEVPEGDPAGGS
jgi:hypothetical protein